MPVAAESPLDDLTRLDQIQRVVANPDPVIRNLQITQTYHELASAIGKAFGEGPNVNWCAFAAWASKQAGRQRRWADWPLPFGLRRLGAAAFRRLMAPAIRSFEDEWKQVATRCPLSLSLPEGASIRLGEDLEPLPGGDAYPAELQSLTLPEVRQFSRRLDRTPDSLQGSAAHDWTILEDRMNYVVDFFRSRQQDRPLLSAPFEAEQVRYIYRGHLPEGHL